MTFKIVPREISHAITEPNLIGKRVRRGPDWCWDGRQDDNGKSAGVIYEIQGGDNNVMVKWDFDGSRNTYRFGGITGKYDLDIVDESNDSTVKIIPRKLSHNIPPESLVGRRVVRGRDWRWDNQDRNGIGTVIRIDADGWLDVKWDHETEAKSCYRFGGRENKDKYDLDVIDDLPESAAVIPEVSPLEHEPEQLDLSKFPEEARDRVKSAPDYIHSMVRKHYGV